MGIGDDPFHSDRVELGDAVIGDLRLFPLFFHPRLLTLGIHPTSEPFMNLVFLGDLHVAVLFLVGLEFLQPGLPRRQRAKSPSEAERLKLGNPFLRQGGGLSFVLDPVILALRIDPLPQSRVFLPLVGYIARAMLSSVLRQLLKTFVPEAFLLVD